MKKETVIKFLTTSYCLLPGNIKSRKKWFLTSASLLSLTTLLFVILTTITEFIGYQKFIRNENIKEALTRLKTVPARPIGFCLKPLANNETLIEIQDRHGVTVERVEVINSTDLQQQNGTIIPAKNVSANDSAPNEPTGDLEDIVSTACRFLIFGTNILVRIFMWISFPSLIDLFTSVFHPEEQNERREGAGDPIKPKNRFMVHLWYEASQGWSTAEKVYIVVIAISQFQREVELISLFYTQIANTGIDLFMIPCLILQALLEQAKVWFSRESALETVAFVLVVIMKTFVNVIAAIAGGALDDNDPSTIGQNTGFFLNEIGGGKTFAKGKFERHAKASVLLVRTRAILMKKEDLGRKGSAVGANGGIATIDEHISGIIGGVGSPLVGYNNKDHLPEGTFRIKKRSHNLGDSSEKSADEIYSQINFVISMYFELMGIWEQASRFTGFVTLVLFCKLTTTFCFNTYITLDNSMNFGLFSGYGASGVVRGIVIVTKLFCVCNAAQELRDMTPVLLDHILKLKLKLLSLPTEHFKTNSKISVDGYMATSQCERCRGLGSFLSEMASYIRGHPFELSALGYFTVSRSTLTTISGVIVTYLVVLVQFQSYAASSSK